MSSRDEAFTLPVSLTWYGVGTITTALSVAATAFRTVIAALRECDAKENARTIVQFERWLTDIESLRDHIYAGRE